MERNTHQKKVVLETVNRLKGMHPTADAVYERVKDMIPSVSRATVYRILNRFAEKRVIKRIKIPGAADVYDTTLDNHYHLRCNACGRVMDVDIPIIEDLCYKVNPSAAYVVTGYDIVFSGYCPDCKAVERTVFF